MLERHLALAHPLGHAPVAGVEALEPGFAVVVAVRVVEIQQQVPAELDLVGRVVREEPGGSGVAQAELQQCGGPREQHADGEHERHGERLRPGTRTREQQQRRRAAEQCGHEAGRARDPHVPLLAGRAHERRERSLRIDLGRPKAPGVGAELRQRDRDQAEQDAEQNHAARGSSPRLGGRPQAGSPRSHPGSARERRRGHAEAILARARSAAGGGVSCARLHASEPAATPSTSHVSGSSRKPLYESA